MKRVSQFFLINAKFNVEVGLEGVHLGHFHRNLTCCCRLEPLGFVESNEFFEFFLRKFFEFATFLIDPGLL